MTISIGTYGNITVSSATRLDKEYLREMAQVINQHATGKLNVTGEFTLDASTTVTVVIDSRSSIQSHISVTPITSDASIANIYITAESKQFTVNHASSTSTTRTFSYATLG